MKYQYYYLSERTYKNNEEAVSSSELKNFWSEIHGKSFLQELKNNLPTVRAYLEDGEIVGFLQNSYVPLEKTSISRTISQWTAEFLEEAKNGVFESFYLEYLSHGLQHLWNRVSRTDVCSDSVYKDFLKVLLSKMQVIGTRVLIEEMHQCKKSGKLKGEGIQAEYSYYDSEMLATKEYQEMLLWEYPILRRCLDEAVNGAVELYAQAIERFTEDRRRLGVLCGNETIHQIQNIAGGLSDPHNGGKSVLKLKLCGGSDIIYKPHLMENEVVFQRLITMLGESCGLEMYPLHIVQGKDYGWVECVEQKSCTNHEELMRYYERLGICQCLVYILGTNDIHCENIIACGEYPVLIDLENLIGIRRSYEHLDVNAKIRAMFQDSVLSSGILPYFYWNQDGSGVNVSAISGEAGQTLPFKVPVIKDKGTSHMRIAYEWGRTGKTDNRATISGVFAYPSEFVKQMCDGFKKAYRYLMYNKEDLVRVLIESRELQSRILMADTQKYSMLLNSAYHPSVMKDGGDRELYLQALWKGQKFENTTDTFLVQSEIRDLLKQDIPYFYFKVHERRLYNSQKSNVVDYFPNPPIDEIIKKIHDMTQAELERQLGLIELSLSMRKNTEDCSEKEILRAIHVIGERLLRDAVYNDERTEVNWMQVRVNSRGDFGWDIHPCGMYLYDGLSGIAVFLHLMKRYVGGYEYCEICDVIDAQLFAHTDSMKKNLNQDQPLNSGIYNGEASIVYAYLILYQMELEDKYLLYAKRHCEVLFDVVEKDKNCDLLDGKAGAVLCFCKMYRFTQRQKYLEAAEKVAHLLYQEAVKTPEGIGWNCAELEKPLLGMAHGNAGISLAFAKLYELTGSRKYYDTLESIIRHEHKRYNENTADWFDYRSQQTMEEELPAAWCHGAGGILLSRLCLTGEMEPTLQEMVDIDIQRGIQRLVKSGMRTDLCLCHGCCGNLLIMESYGRRFDWDEERTRWCREGLKSMVRQAGHFEFEIMQEKYGPGIMNGYLGVGYYLILHYGVGAPDYLFLEEEKEKNRDKK